MVGIWDWEINPFYSKCLMHSEWHFEQIMGAFGHPKEEAGFDTQRVTRREEVFSLLERYLGKPTVSKPGEQSSRFQSLCSTLDLLQNLHFNESPLYPPPSPLLPAKGLIVNIQIGEALLLKSEQISMVVGFNCCHICLLILIICIFCWMLPFTILKPSVKGC